MDTARNYAEKAIRHKQNAFSLERLSTQLGFVAQKIDPANKDRSLGSIVSNITLPQEDIESMDQTKLEALMEQFQKAFKDSNVKNEGMQLLDNVYQGSLDQGEIDALIRQIAKEHKLPLRKEIGEAGTNRAGQSTPASND